MRQPGSIPRLEASFGKPVAVGETWTLNPPDLEEVSTAYAVNHVPTNIIVEKTFIATVKWDKPRIDK